MTARASIVCICGSTRFKEEIEEVNRRETLAGNIVLAPGVFIHSGDDVSKKEKEALDMLHHKKIDLCEFIIVVSRDGYIGESTRNEINYASKIGKIIRFYDFKKRGE